jgi:ABC-2 type transport system permease protein
MTARAALAPYLAVVSARYRQQLQYRAAAVAGMATQAFWGALKLMVLAAFYDNATASPPIGLREVVAYVWLGQALLALLPWNVEEALAQEIRSGNVAIELLRPLDLYALWFARTLAFRTARASLRALPMFVLACGLLPLLGLERWALAAPSALSGLAFAGSLVVTVVLATAITMLLQISLLYTISAEGVLRMTPAVVLLCSGMMVPLPLFPEPLQPLLHALTEPDPGRRTPSAAAALAHLRAIGGPASDVHPLVPDRLSARRPRLAEWLDRRT